jgi:hypothetical protein
MIPFAKLIILIIENHQNTSHTFHTHSKFNLISSSFLQVIDVLFEAPCKYQIPNFYHALCGI